MCPAKPHEDQEGLWDCKKDQNVDKQTCKLQCASKKYRASCQCRKGSCKWNWSGDLNSDGTIIFPEICESLVTVSPATGTGPLSTTTSTTLTVSSPESCPALEHQELWNCEINSNLNKQKCFFDCETNGKNRLHKVECKCRNGKCSWKGKTGISKCENKSENLSNSDAAKTTTSSANLAMTSLPSTSQTCSPLPAELEHFKCSKMDGNSFVHNSLCKGRCQGKMKRINCICQNLQCEWSAFDSLCFL